MSKDTIARSCQDPPSRRAHCPGRQRTDRGTVDLETLLQQLLLLQRLQCNEVDAARVQNGTRTWNLPPALSALGLQWIQDQAQGIAHDNLTLRMEDFSGMEGTFHIEDFRGTRNPIWTRLGYRMARERGASRQPCLRWGYSGYRIRLKVSRTTI